MAPLTERGSRLRHPLVVAANYFVVKIGRNTARVIYRQVKSWASGNWRNTFQLS